MDSGERSCTIARQKGVSSVGQWAERKRFGVNRDTIKGVLCRRAAFEGQRCRRSESKGANEGARGRPKKVAQDAEKGKR